MHYELVKANDRRAYSETVATFDTLEEAVAALKRLVAENENDLASPCAATRNDAKGWDFYVWDAEDEGCVA